MKIKLDENLPAGLARELERLGHDVQTSPSEGLTGKSDEEIWDRTQNEGRFLITQDLDFSDSRRFSPGTHHGLLLVRLSSPTRSALLRRVAEVFRQENVSGWPGCFIVISERKIRIRRRHAPGT